MIGSHRVDFRISKITYYYSIILFVMGFRILQSVSCPVNGMTLDANKTAD
jgi:hypothetical protein